MAGIYVHIPFCRKACHYCNFHFSTSLHHKTDLLQALQIELSAQYYPGEVIPERNIATIYFGGGTPSLLEAVELEAILLGIHANFSVSPAAEITLEANPDDITPEKLSVWKTMGINRLSIGIQSFFEEDLRWMNRAHTASQAINAIRLAQAVGFNNLTIDLIYGTPTLTDEHWQQNMATAFQLGIPHLSCYALTVEDNTALAHFISKGKVPPVAEEKQEKHFLMLMEQMAANGYDHYEISNFCQPGHHSRHNSNYWNGEPYYGYGPAAHSFDGSTTRWWNIANNPLYIKAMQEGATAFEAEKLSPVQVANEMIMTRLRMKKGLEMDAINHSIAGKNIDSKSFTAFAEDIKRFEQQELLVCKNGLITLTNKGKLIADGITAKLFLS